MAEKNVNYRMVMTGGGQVRKELIAIGQAGDKAFTGVGTAAKDRFLTEAEVDRLVDAANEPHVRLAILLMLNTAGRVGAILDLTWDRVDFRRGRSTSALTAPGRARAEPWCR